MRKDGIAAEDFKKTVKHLGDFWKWTDSCDFSDGVLCDVLTVIWKVILILSFICVYFSRFSS
jgi:hypothetical protein